MQDFWAKQDGFEEIDAWIEQLDTPDKIETHRTRSSNRVRPVHIRCRISGIATSRRKPDGTPRPRCTIWKFITLAPTSAEIQVMS